MSQNKKIKVAWICYLSNEEIRSRLCLRTSSSKAVMKDNSMWNTYAINEFKKFDDIELHVISPFFYMTSKLEEFTIDGVHYHIFKSEDDYFSFQLKRKFLKGKYETPDYKHNSKVILSIIKAIKPEIIHVIGAENPNYSLSALSMPKDIPLIVALQTLMIDPEFYSNYLISKKQYDYRSGIEKNVLKRADYISCRSKRFMDIVRSIVNPDVKILDLPLFVGENINMAECNKEYDFVYFAKEIEKAVDWAIEAFALAQKEHPGIKLNIVGGYSSQTKINLDNRLEELNITKNVIFCGPLPTHDDVIKQIRKSRFAILPLKIDLISGTIREAMANGLPVVTTITPATPKLNETRESVLLSEKGDFKAMAENMLRLINDNELVMQLKNNSYQTIRERYDNSKIAQEWRNQYYNVINEWQENK